MSVLGSALKLDHSVAMAQFADDDDDLPVVKPTRYAGTVDLSGEDDGGGDVDEKVDDVIDKEEVKDDLVRRYCRMGDLVRRIDFLDEEEAYSDSSMDDELDDDVDDVDDDADDDVDDDADSGVDFFMDVSDVTLIREITRRGCWNKVPSGILIRELLRGDRNKDWVVTLETTAHLKRRRARADSMRHRLKGMRRKAKGMRREIVRKDYNTFLDKERRMILVKEMGSVMASAMEKFVDSAKVTMMACAGDDFTGGSFASAVDGGAVVTDDSFAGAVDGGVVAADDGGGKPPYIKVGPKPVFQV
jgi:hypothetical protein